MTERPARKLRAGSGFGIELVVAGGGVTFGVMRAARETNEGMKQIDAGVLNIGYAEAGPTDGPAVILLHGWPYDIHSFVEVAPRLSAAGYKVIVPHLRGYGTTRFLSGTLP